MKLSEPLSYCWANLSHLPIFFLDSTVAYWDNEEKVYYRGADDKNWTGLWDDRKDFRNDLLCYLNMSKGSRTASLVKWTIIWMRSTKLSILRLAALQSLMIRYRLSGILPDQRLISDPCGSLVNKDD